METSKNIGARARIKAETKERHAQIRSEALDLVNRFQDGFSDFSLQHQLAWDKCSRIARALAHRKALRIKDLKNALDVVAKVPTMTRDQCVYLLVGKTNKRHVDARQISIATE